MYSGQVLPVQKYDRKIKYLDYMENGSRSRGAGFVKLELRDGSCNISLQVSGLYRKDRFTRPFLLLCGEEEMELCKLQLHEGGVKLYMEKLDSRNLDGKGLTYEQVTGLRIPVSEGKEIRCVWDGETDRAEKKEVFAALIEEHEPEGQAVQPEEPEPMQAMKAAPLEEAARTVEITPMGEPEREGAPFPMREDKWQQLWAIYPHKKPFRDEREYLSMGPEDFVILPKRFYKLVNNSFLLHGYYNYRHVIMGRVEQRGSVKYYIGVPGNYYEREKKIAVMFGFESFECGAEPAQEGDFGYYMIAVEL